MIVSLEHVFKYYGADCILRDVNAAINEKDRIGLVGANGEGKTTLLNVLTGGLDYEEGSVSLTNGKVIGYLHQNSGLSNGRTIQQEMEAVFADLIALGQEVDALQKQMAQVHDNPQEYERVSASLQNIRKSWPALRPGTATRLRSRSTPSSTVWALAIMTATSSPTTSPAVKKPGLPPLACCSWSRTY